MDVLAFQRKRIDASCQTERSAYTALDRAVWDAYGWPAEEIPAEIEEDGILSRLLALN